MLELKNIQQKIMEEFKTQLEPLVDNYSDLDVEAQLSFSYEGVKVMWHFYANYKVNGVSKWKHEVSTDFGQQDYYSLDFFEKEFIEEMVNELLITWDLAEDCEY